MFKRSWLLLVLLIPSFLLSADAEKQIVIKAGEKNHAWLGVRVDDLSKEMLDKLSLPHGVKITKVYKDSPAAEAELQPGDIIISVDGQNITSTKNLIELIKEKKVGDIVELEYLRDESRSKVKAKLAQTMAQKAMVRPPRTPYRFDFIAEDQTWLGVHTTGLTPQLRDYFGVPQEQGILIKEVLKDSPAEKGGLKAGDVIIKVAEKKVRDLRDIKRAINYFEPGDEIEIKVIREKKEKSVRVKLEERKGTKDVYFYGNDEGEFETPIPAEIDIDIPEIEIELDDLEAEHESLLHELPQKLEWEMQGLNEKLFKLNDKLKGLRLRVKTADYDEIEI